MAFISTEMADHFSGLSSISDTMPPAGHPQLSSPDISAGLLEGTLPAEALAVFTFPHLAVVAGEVHVPFQENIHLLIIMYISIHIMYTVCVILKYSFPTFIIGAKIVVISRRYSSCFRYKVLFDSSEGSVCL